jgi:Circularly permutated YpsA SLOG family
MSIMERVISGGLTGADQAGLRAARARGIPTGGWAPRGWLTEAGPAPWLAEWGLVECPEGETETESYRARRRRCVKDSFAALCFGDITSPGSRSLDRDCQALGKQLVYSKSALTTPRHIAEYIRISRIRILMIAGNRESRQPGIGERVEGFLIVVFKSLGFPPRSTA